MSSRGDRLCCLLSSLLCACTFDASGLSPRGKLDGQSGQPDQVGTFERAAPADGLIPGVEGMAVADRGKPVDASPVCPISCLLGCATSSTTCRQHTPSNLGGVTLPPPCKSATLAAGSKISTTGCTLTGGCVGAALAKLCVIRIGALSIPAGVTVRVEGDKPLVIVAEGDVTVGGTLDGTGIGTDPGPGGGKGGVPASATQGTPGGCPAGLTVCGAGSLCSGCTTDDCGGGGGAYAADGANGGLDGSGTTCAKQSLGGKAYGDPSLVPLIGGSGGASGANASTGDPAPAAGGGGGGAIQISTQGVLRIDGVINAGGGGGIAGKGGGGCGNSAGGGGSGGAVLLEAPSIVGTGWVAANGGGGGGGAYPGTNALPGEAGRGDATPAAGGTGSGNAGSGGKGGTGTAASTPGISAAEAGGGGGGGAGRVRLNWDKVHFPAPTIKVSGFKSESQLQIP